MMNRIVGLFFVTLISIFSTNCGRDVDNRPADLDYIVATILRPSCGTAACHSSLTKTAGFAFDTVDMAREAFASGGNRPLIVSGDPSASRLWKVLIGANLIMPPDGPIPDKDLDLIETWILTRGGSN